jgi:hypothetical protein
MRKILERAKALFRYEAPVSIMKTEPIEKPAPALSNLYILRVNFPVTQPIGERLEASLNVLRNKYGVDFFVLEPGMELSRFDDI